MHIFKTGLKVFIPLLILGLGVIIFAYLLETKPVIEPEVAGERIWPVETLAAQHKDQSINLLLFGTLVAARDVELRSLVGGEVIEVSPNFREGGILKQGELLIA
ncbi:MAG: hypothetical protein V7701_08750, partial [Sneathiella sp.]